MVLWGAIDTDGRVIFSTVMRIHFARSLMKLVKCHRQTNNLVPYTIENKSWKHTGLRSMRRKCVLEKTSASQNIALCMGLFILSVASKKRLTHGCFR